MTHVWTEMNSYTETAQLRRTSSQSMFGRGGEGGGVDVQGLDNNEIAIYYSALAFPGIAILGLG
jgi:hypothetical protein